MKRWIAMISVAVSAATMVACGDDDDDSAKLTIPQPTVNGGSVVGPSTSQPAPSLPGGPPEAPPSTLTLDQMQDQGNTNTQTGS